MVIKVFISRGSSFFGSFHGMANSPQPPGAVANYPDWMIILQIIFLRLLQQSINNCSSFLWFNRQFVSLFLLLLVPANATGHLRQRLQLLGHYELKFLDKVVKVFVAGVDVRLGAYTDDPVKVVDVDVHKDAEESRQDLATHRGERLGERHVRRDREDVLVVDLRLGPVHQQFNVAWGRQLGGLLERLSVCPQILVAWPTRHRLAGQLVAVVRDCPIDQVDAIEKVNDWGKRQR